MGCYPIHVLGSEKATFFDNTAVGHFLRLIGWLLWLGVPSHAWHMWIQRRGIASQFPFFTLEIIQITETNFGAYSDATPLDAEALLSFDVCQFGSEIAFSIGFTETDWNAVYAKWILQLTMKKWRMVILTQMFTSFTHRHIASCFSVF